MITIIYTLLLIILGFLIAELQNAYLGKQEKTSKEYFSLIGVTFTQNDFQRLLFAIFLGIGIMFLLPQLIELTGYKINGYIVYIITGYSPSTVMLFVKKKVKSKAGMNDLKQTSGGHSNPNHEEH